MNSHLSFELDLSDWEPDLSVLVPDQSDLQPNTTSMRPVTTCYHYGLRCVNAEACWMRQEFTTYPM